MPKETTPPDKKPAKRRQRDNNGHQVPTQTAMEVFADQYTKDKGKGRVTRAAQVAYPNQKPNSAAVTGSRLLRHPKVDRLIKKRLDRASRMAQVDREALIGMLMEIASASLGDIQNESHEIDWATAKKKGKDHLVKEISVTERHSKDGSSRSTTTYKMYSRHDAIDLLTDILGLKKQPAKNPLDTAREVFKQMRTDEKYSDMSDAELARYPALRFKVPIEDLLMEK